MTGPYQPPGGDINSPFGPPDPNSPFTPGPGSGGSEPEGEGAKGEEESSSLGVQYELEAPGQPPMTPPPRSGPPAYGPPAPPPSYAPQPTYTPPPKKSSNNGLIIGGVIAGVVLLLCLAGVIIVVVSIGDDSSDGGGSTGGDKATYTIPSDPCTDVDMSSIEAIGSFETSPTSSSNPSETYGYGSCYGSFGTYGEGNYGYYSLNVNTYNSDSSVQTGWDSATGSSYMSGCDTSDVSGSWDQGKLGTGSSCGSPVNGSKTVLSIQSDNLVATLSLDGETDVGSTGSDALQSVAESLLTASKA